MLYYGSILQLQDGFHGRGKIDGSLGLLMERDAEIEKWRIRKRGRKKFAAETEAKSQLENAWDEERTARSRRY